MCLFDFSDCEKERMRIYNELKDIEIREMFNKKRKGDKARRQILEQRMVILQLDRPRYRGVLRLVTEEVKE